MISDCVFGKHPGGIRTVWAVPEDRVSKWGIFDCPVNRGLITSCRQLGSQRAALCRTSPCHVWALIGCLGSRPTACDWWKIRASLLKTYWQTDMQRRKGGLPAGARHCLCAQTQRGKCERTTKQSRLLPGPKLCNIHVNIVSYQIKLFDISIRKAKTMCCLICLVLHFQVCLRTHRFYNHPFMMPQRAPIHFRVMTTPCKQ